MRLPFRPDRPPEHVLIETRPHWRGLVRPSLVAVIGAGIAGLAGGFAELQAPAYDGGDTFTPIILVIAVLYLLVVLRFTVVPWMRWRSQVFVVTDQRLVGRSGIVSKNRFEMPLGRVNAVQYRHTMSDRVFGTGTLIVETATGDYFEFPNLPSVSAVHEVLYQLVAPVRRPLR